MRKATAFAPATVANVAVGFDILGFALQQIGEWATVQRIEKRSDVVLDPLEHFPEISLDPLKNTATAGLVRLLQEKKYPFGFRVRLRKEIPVGSGLGGSSTSAVAALVAANALLPKRLKIDELLDYALTGEAVASGSRHADNVGPSLLGGLVYCRSYLSDESLPQFSLVPVPTPSQLRCVILLPKLSIKTSEARKLLSTHVPMKAFVQQTSHLAGFLLGCAKNDYSLIKSSLQDVVIEPQRSALIPGFSELQKAALQAGALGFSISGSGPAMFALVKGDVIAKRVQSCLQKTAHQLSLPLQGSWISKISPQGAHLLKAGKGRR